MEKFYPTINPNKDTMSVISIRMYESKIQKIDELSNQVNISRNKFINQCIDYAISNFGYTVDNTMKQD